MKSKIIEPVQKLSQLIPKQIFSSLQKVEPWQWWQKKQPGFLLHNLMVEVVSDMDRCKDLWNEFSPKKSLFDTWKFRLAFWHGYKHRPYFLTIKDGDTVLGLLPLWHEADREGYYWFGSWWHEDNTFLVKDPLFIPLLLAAAPKPLFLNAIKPNGLAWLQSIVPLVDDDAKYVLDLTNLKSSEDFLVTLKKKRRYNIRRDVRIISQQNPVVEIDRWEDFDQLVALSKARFKSKGEDTDWDDQRRVETFRKVIQFGRSKSGYKSRMISVRIGGSLAAVDLVTIYKGIYYPLKCGYDVENFPGIGNFVNMFEIDDAIRMGMKKVDFLEINYGWKEKWFTSVPLLKYEKK